MKSTVITTCAAILLSAAINLEVNAQSAVSSSDSIKVAAREIMKETTYCALTTVDSAGQPQMRTMNPFPANDEFITWFATSRETAGK